MRSKCGQTVNGYTILQFSGDVSPPARKKINVVFLLYLYDLYRLFKILRIVLRVICHFAEDVKTCNFCKITQCYECMNKFTTNNQCSCDSDVCDFCYKKICRGKCTNG